MYRRYEDPWALEDALKEAKERYAKAVARGENDYVLFDLHEDVAELEERVNFAWQDQEYDEMYASC